ncbi:EamA family transporter RarD [Pseudomonas sp. TTU2014-080ASC]|uniref:EamA family transporter RarD n=1 Tax=Pseudomonas sp. TTU2014-080ASC TaxID=1729724 RepID=UPI0007186900|nr:EamA family transporter RarD [Pseudomonas sp. TTU2014-080ASC]KRW62450.1 chemotaxis protein [Pseudomonas sp. TTU2014-080ASC]
MQLSGRGVALSLLASVLFAMVPGYVRFLEPLDGLQVFAHRVLWSIPAVLLLITLLRQWPNLLAAFARVRRDPILMLCLPLAALLMGTQWFLFLWAPLQGRMLEISMGYFLTPLAMVLAGRIFYGERLRPLLRLAVFSALLGVAHELWRTGAFSWLVLLVTFGYPPYYMLRRRMGLDALSGLVFEMMLMAPVAIWLVLQYGPQDLFGHSPQLLWLLPGLAVLTSAAFGSLIASSRLLPLGLFGILSYVEPVLLFLVALVFLGEHFDSAQWLTYLPIWLAVLLVGLDSGRVLMKQARQVD